MNVAHITTRLPEEVVRSLDLAARTSHRSRADVVRQAIERYLEDFEDLNLAVERLRDPADLVLDWETVKRALLAQD
jgi:RHH-type rel operon transcriptional repressor/antitoxin RelB